MLLDRKGKGVGPSEAKAIVRVPDVVALHEAKNTMVVVCKVMMR